MIIILIHNNDVKHVTHLLWKLYHKKKKTMIYGDTNGDAREDITNNMIFGCIWTCGILPGMAVSIGYGFIIRLIWLHYFDNHYVKSTASSPLVGHQPWSSKDPGISDAENSRFRGDLAEQQLRRWVNLEMVSP